MNTRRNRVVAAVAALFLGLGMMSGCTVVTGPDGTPEIVGPTELPDINITVPPIDPDLPTVDSDAGGSDAGDSASSGSDGNDETETQPAPQDHDLWSGIVTALIALIALGVVLAIAGKARRDRADAERTHSLQRRQVSNLVKTGRWAVDQARQLAASPNPAALAGVQASLTSYLTDAEERAARLASDVSDSTLATAISELATRLAALRGATSVFLDAASHSPTAAHGERLTQARTDLTDAQHAVETATRDLIPHTGSL